MDYRVGDQVYHSQFGKGIVENIQDGVRDFEVTVIFDRVGKRKMFASFAKLEKM